MPPCAKCGPECLELEVAWTDCSDGRPFVEKKEVSCAYGSLLRRVSSRTNIKKALGEVNSFQNREPWSKLPQFLIYLLQQRIERDVMKNFKKRAHRLLDTCTPVSSLTYLILQYLPWCYETVCVAFVYRKNGTYIVRSMIFLQTDTVNRLVQAAERIVGARPGDVFLSPLSDWLSLNWTERSRVQTRSLRHPISQSQYVIWDYDGRYYRGICYILIKSGSENQSVQ